MSKSKKRRPRSRLKNEYHKPDVANWTLDAIDKAMDGLHTLIKRAASEALTIAFSNAGTYISWPAEFGNSDGHSKEGPVDPLTIYLTVALGTSDASDPVYSFNLRSALADTIEDWRERGPFFDSEDAGYGESLLRIAAALNTLAHDIESAVKGSTTI